MFGQDLPNGGTLMRLTDQQWLDVVTILSSYRADLMRDHPDECGEYVKFIEALIEEINDEQHNGTEIEFEIDWDHPVSDDELDS